MKLRRLVITLALLALAATVLPASADEPYPVLGEPVLRPDTQWVRTDWGYKHKDLSFPAGNPWPTILTMEGYDGAGVPNAYLRMDDGELMALRFVFGQGPRRDYALVYASIRGTECSGGQFNLYDRRHAWDGHHIIEWIARQPWSNGNVGMIGWSFSGQTAYWTAATRPPHLKAVSANLLHSDIYRDIFMPGGVQNYLFPVVWYLASPHRAPTGSLGRGTIPNDEICTQLQANRYSAGEPPNVEHDAIFAAIEPTDNDWYVGHAATTFAPAIRIPYYQQNNWQDEQTGPRAAVLHHFINPDPVTIIGKDGEPRTVIPKKFALSNGGHGFGDTSDREMWPWFDIWLLGMPDSEGLLDSPVTNYFEIRSNGTYTAKKSGPSWPFPDTEWTKLYLHEGRGLSEIAPTGPEATDTYLSVAPTRNWPVEVASAVGLASSVTSTARSLPDAVVYETAPLGQDLVIAGPILAEVYASLAGTDADLFVGLYDVYPDGRISYIQRGVLKASHRRVDPERSWYAPDGRLIQPYRPHTNPQPVVPGEVVKYDIEVWPAGHIFRAGHKLMVQIHTPPLLDGIWGYTPTHHPPAAVTVQHDAEHPSAMQLPVITSGLVPGTVGPPEDCRVPGGFPCWEPSGL